MKRTATMVAMIAALAAMTGRQGAVAAPAPADEARALIDHLVRVLELEAKASTDDCAKGELLLTAMRHAAESDRARLQPALRELFRPESKLFSMCLDTGAAGLVGYLPPVERRAAVAAILDRIEANAAGYVEIRGALAELAPTLDSAEVSRLVRHARRAKTDCCTRAIVLAYLAAAQKAALSNAVTAARDCKENCVWDANHLLPILPLVDQATRDRLLRGLLASLKGRRVENMPHLEIYSLGTLGTLAPYLEAGRRRALMIEGFQAIRALGLKGFPANSEADMPLYFQVLGGLGALAPYLTADLVGPALASVPERWEAETRAEVIGYFAAALPPGVRKETLAVILRAIPGPAASLHHAKARLMVASDLPEAEVRSLLARFLELSPANERVAMLAGLYHVVPPADRPAIADRIRRDIAGMEDGWRQQAAMGALKTIAATTPR